MILGKRIQSFSLIKQKDAEVWLKQQEKIKPDARLGIRRITSAREQVAAMAFEMLEKHDLEDEAILDAVKTLLLDCGPAQKDRSKGSHNGFPTAIMRAGHKDSTAPTCNWPSSGRGRSKSVRPQPA
jgi:hypothetical protein